MVEKTDGPTLQAFVHHRTEPTTLVYTDEAAAYNRLNRPHEAVAHSVGEYVRDMAHTNGMGVLLVPAQAGPHWDLPLDEPEASRPLRY